MVSAFQNTGVESDLGPGPFTIGMEPKASKI